jgi:predicted regulator of Ras-like GTPase activity (Roadblock/LC7/MglB family)
VSWSPPAQLRTPQEFGWLISNFVASTPGVSHALIVSSDGLPLLHSDELPADLADPLAALVSGILSLGNNIARQVDGGGCDQILLRLTRGHFVFMGIGELAGLGVLVEAGANLGAVAHQMAQLVASVGHALTPELRDDLRRHVQTAGGAS